MELNSRLKIFLNDYLRSEIMRNASVLISGTVLAQIVSILIQPVVRRLFQPEAFGVYTIYSSLAGILVVAAALKYDDAIVLPEKERESAALAGLSLFLSLFFSLLIALILLIFGEWFFDLFGLDKKYTDIFTLLLPLCIFLYSINGSLNAWLVRRKSFKAVAVNKLVRRSSEALGQTSTGLSGVSGGLIISDIIGHLTNLISLIIQTCRTGLYKKIPSLSDLKIVIRKYSVFPKYNLVPSLLSACSYLLPPLFINRFYSAEFAGFFDLSRLVLSLPLAFIAGSVSSVTLQKVTERFNRNESFIYDLKPLIITVIAISFAEVVIIVLFGKMLFGLFFGPEWTYSGIISQIMVWSFAISFIVSSFSSIFLSLRKIKIYGLWQLFYFTCILTLILGRKMEYEEFLRFYVSIEVVCYLSALVLLSIIVIKYEGSLKAASDSES